MGSIYSTDNDINEWSELLTNEQEFAVRPTDKIDGGGDASPMSVAANAIELTPLWPKSSSSAQSSSPSPSHNRGGHMTQRSNWPPDHSGSGSGSNLRAPPPPPPPTVPQKPPSKNQPPPPPPPLPATSSRDYLLRKSQQQQHHQSSSSNNHNLSDHAHSNGGQPRRSGGTRTPQPTAVGSLNCDQPAAGEAGLETSTTVTTTTSVGNTKGPAPQPPTNNNNNVQGPITSQPGSRLEFWIFSVK